MDALILSCSTGGGHNAAAEAIREALESRGDRATVMNPYALTSPRRMRKIDRAYVSLAQKAPKGFGLVYRLGDLYSRSGLRSPIYYLNHKAALALDVYLRDHPADVLICPHLFPAEVATQMKRHGLPRPRTIFVATDYTCIPFTEETDCDAYVIPSEDLREEFVGRGLPEEKLHPLGIPTRQAFSREMTRTQARQELGLEGEGPLYLLSGGSMGAGWLRQAIRLLRRRCSARLAVICGSNNALYEELESQYGDALILLHATDRMDLWLRACDVYFTKPGGLSSTEAAVTGTLLVHLPPIPGCETKNAEFFARRGMSLRLDEGELSEEGLDRLLARLDDPQQRREMVECQGREANARSADLICGLAHALAEGGKEG